MFAHQYLSSLVHSGCIQRHTLPAQCASLIARSGSPVENRVAVTALRGRKPGVEIGPHDGSPMYGHSSIEMGIGAECPGTQRAIKLCVEVNDLRCRMDSCIRSAGTINRDRLLSNPAQCLLELCLYRVTMWLALPTAKALAIIFDGEGNSGFSQWQSHAFDHEILRSSVSASLTCAGLPLLTISSRALLAESLSPMSI